MKHIQYILFLLNISLVIYSQDYYWYKNQKIFLEQGDERYVLFCPEGKAGINSSTYVKIGVASDSSLMWGVQKRDQPIPENIKYIAPSYYIEKDSSNIYLTELFYVQLKQKEDYDMLVRYATEHDVKIVEEGAFQLWYILSCTERSKGNALAMANMFYESGLFETAEPEIINANRLACVNDPLFSQQWNLLNTGQKDINYTGVDINYCEAHSVTSGVDSIIIALIDYGIDSHLDVSFLYSLSYDAHKGTYPAQVYSSHGTQCAGIIGAHSDNNHGVAGIASDCSIISISFNEITSGKNIANGIKFAIEHNASVLSNSWQRYVLSTYIDNAIDSALIYGRDGKGCIVVFAAGNDNASLISYPANSNPDIITVGAMTPSAMRADEYGWGSNYGYGLDIMAPGEYIPTTIPNGFTGDFCLNFDGTSAACPHVAAVAGLVLSVNPNLTQQEVAHYIESTAQKVGNYNYDSIAPNGMWNNEMGYGLVDAYGAVVAARDIQYDKFIQDTIYSNGTACAEYSKDLYAGYHVTDNKPQGEVLIQTGSNVKFIARNKIELRPGFRVEPGATFKAIIEAPSQAPSAPSNVRKRETHPADSNNDNADVARRHIDAFSVSPNPVNAILHIQTTEELAQVKIYNLNGQRVLQSAQTDIDVSALPQGMYILRAETTDGNAHQTKFIKR